MKHSEIIKHSTKYLKKSTTYWKCSVAFSELSTACIEKPDVLGFASGYSTLIEAKASRSDFLKDKKKYFRQYPQDGMGRYRLYACPTGLIKPEELPEKWGLIYVSPKGDCELIVKPQTQESNLRAEQIYMYSVFRRILIKPSSEKIENFIIKYAERERTL